MIDKLEKLQEIIRRYRDDENIAITNDMVFITDLELNSYELTEMVCEVEEAFGLEIPDRAIGGFKTVQDLIDFISAHE